MRTALIATLLGASLAAARALEARQSILQGALATVDCVSDSVNPDECSGETIPHGKGNDLKDVIANVTGLPASFEATPNTPFGCVPALANPPSSFCATIIDGKANVDHATALSALNLISKQCSLGGSTARCGHTFINGKDKSGGVLQVQFTVHN